MVEKVITNLDSKASKAFWPDCISVVFVKNYESELSYILAELFNMCLKESCFPDCWKVSSVVPVFKNVGERSTAKKYRPVSLYYVVSKVFKKFTLKLTKTLYCQHKLKPRYVLFWSYYCPGPINQNRTIRGRPQNVMWRLWSKIQNYATIVNGL